MQHHRLSWALAVSIMLTLLLTHIAGAAPQDPRCALVETYLKHYVLQEYSQAKGALVSAKHNAFGPYPFTQPPVLAEPKVNKRQAVVDFTAPVIDSAYPTQGGVLLYNDQGTWKVRQILFYKKVPALFHLPSQSVTDEDRRQEPTVKQVAASFLTAWRSGKSSEMLDHWYAWPERADDPVKGLRFHDCSVTITALSTKDSCANFCANLSYKWGLLSYNFQLKGRLLLTREGESWKVRGNILIFDF